ncbi:hypothetical protein GGS23DRAFT_538817 [Durotheca rogersii]|uniref:uncharacterized protein n=1 Tax=Durotheca rogersii TaxID=419775 RepID=UPI0022209B73|nr:uncharacterized protein GGS23DRAFT_538817 [Durotheca rogersii]KAI5863540.1 hypothetical protein GGS23DRAFT_538817 [Durotheca rogersii]
MEIPRYAPREPGGPPPAIYIEGASHFDHHGGPGRSRPQPSRYSPALASVPVSIPNLRRRAEDDAPPPLIPPKYIPGLEQPGSVRHDRIPSVDSNASWESSRHDLEHDRPRFGRCDSDQPIVRPHRDEGYHSLNSTMSQDSLPKKLFMTHDQYQFNRQNSEYDIALIKKLDSRRTFENRTPPRLPTLSASASDASSRFAGHSQRPHPQLTPLSLPISLPIRPSNKLVMDSPGRYTDTPPQSALSPRGASFYGASSNEYRSPVELTDPDRSPFSRTRRNNSGSFPDDATISTHSSYENIVDDNDFSMGDASHMEDVVTRSEHHATGQKRRASSPPGDDVPMQGMPGSYDLLRRREGASRASPQPRLAAIPQGSVSSVSTTRSGSYASTVSLATNFSSMNSFTGRSPGGLSSGGLSPVDMIGNSPYNIPNPHNHSPRASFARPPHQRNLSETRRLTSPRKVTEVPKSGISKIPGGFFMCECCPKKPKKFETSEELRAHEAEKQYECTYCGNRFKNKNEAERHQNSLHVRRHSWSCSALLPARYDRAFHESTNRPGEADTCGYCGDEFERRGGVGRPRQPTEQDWEERLRHLQEVHKFRECNASKKFYRADHFRQHLKHSHAGTSGKWTNMLENACMLEEEPPQPAR